MMIDPSTINPSVSTTSSFPWQKFRMGDNFVPFSGEGEGSCIDTWAATVTHRLSVHEVPRNDWHRLAMDLLAGPAATWFSTLVQQSRLENNDPLPFKSWDEFEAAIRSFHSKKNPIIRLRLRLVKFKCSENASPEEILVHLEEFTKLAVSARVLDKENELLVSLLVNSLPHKFQSEAEDFLLEKEADFYRMKNKIIDLINRRQNEPVEAQARFNAVDARGCTHCGKLNHKANECWMKYPNLRRRSERSNGKFKRQRYQGSRRSLKERGQ